ncbi:hypothetical protein [Variovorax paradoxus]|uniref:hypothetical protein n=1 Tax=Variovorax paradoxus TaxID=34073 RepID=UPI001A93D2E7|nr:hypothetical protein [Variovorax paradoxus]
MLIVLGGLPGTGKTAIACELVARSPSAYLRIDFDASGGGADDNDVSDSLLMGHAPL